MSAQARGTKAEKQQAVSEAVLEVIEREGLLGVTHSKVSRRSGVSRAWIYEYVGKDKGTLIEFAANVIARRFTRAQVQLPKSREGLEEQLKEGVHLLFESAIAEPVVIKLYFRFRGTTNPIGEAIQKYEKQWLKGAAESASNILGVSTEQSALLAEIILTLRLGFAHRLATSSKPKETRQSAEKVFGYIHGLLSGGLV